MDLSDITGAATYPIWEKIGIKQRHGINVLLSSLHTKKSCGIGEYLDLIPLIDWCAKVPLDVIQLLPLNDTGMDPSPYNAQSSCALHPIFLSLHALPYLEEMQEQESLLKGLRKHNLEEQVPYHLVQAHKLYFLKGYVEKVKEKITKLPTFRDFVRKNAWLPSYSLFKVLKEDLENNNCSTWPANLQNLSFSDLAELYKKYEDRMLFYTILQYFCFQQMTYVKEYADKHNILLKGDIPILISPDSADVWVEPYLFEQNLSAGAPPDAYNDAGQNWGFPLFHWEKMEEQDFSWWKTRLQVASQFYHIYRIDHIIGFFRIWGIEKGKAAKEGTYFPLNSEMWIPQGKKLLSMMIASSPMLPIGEDLGNVSPDIRQCMKELGICGTKVMRWERDWDHGRRFYTLEEYPLLSMTCVSTHDSETLELWWEEKEEEARDYAASKNWNYQKDFLQKQREEILWDSHHTKSLFHINLLQEYLALFPELVHKDPSRERINVPGTILETNWTYRILPSVEEITENAALLQKIREVVFAKK